MILSQNVLDFTDRVEPAVDHQVQMWEGLLEVEDPIILERRDVSILLRVESLKEGLTCVDYKLATFALFRDDFNELKEVFPRIVVVHSEPTLYRDRYVTLQLHFFDDLRY